MNYGTVPGLNKQVSRFVFGTMLINSTDLNKSLSLLDEIYATGCNTFDTAHVYGYGESERTIGCWITARGLRDQVVVISKGAHHNVDRKRVTPFDIAADLHDSLARLNTDYVDLYLLHRDDPQVPVGEIMQALNDQVRAGRICAFGGSNWSHARLQEANEYASAHGLMPMVASSPQFSLAEQVHQPWPDCISISGAQGLSARQWYAQNQMALFTWSSLAGGFLSGRFTRNNLDSFEDELEKLCIQSYGTEANFQRLDRLAMLSKERGVAIPQLALAYILQQPLNIFAIVGSLDREKFKDNLEASKMHISPQELAWLDLQSH